MCVFLLWSQSEALFTLNVPSTYKKTIQSFLVKLTKATFTSGLLNNVNYIKLFFIIIFSFGIYLNEIIYLFVDMNSYPNTV